MGNKFFTLTFLLSLSVWSLAQQTTIDSLLRLIASSTSDTAKIFLYESLGETYYMEKKMDSSVFSFQYALELNKKNGFSLQKQCRNAAAIDYRLNEMGDYLASLNYAALHLALSEKINDTLQKGIAHLAYGHNFREMGYYRQALDHYFMAKEYCKSYWIGKNKPEDNAYTLQCIADTYLKIGELDSAFSYANQAYSYAIRDSIPGRILLSDRIFGDIFFAKGNYEMALKYYREYLTNFIKYKETNRDLGFVLNGLAMIFQKKGQTDSTILYAKKALVNAQEYQDQGNIFKAASLLYDSYKERHDDSAALQYLELAVRAKDSVLSIEKSKQAQILSFNEQMREKVRKEVEERETRKAWILATALGILSLIGAYFISNRIRQLRLKHKEYD
jgi:tetratricopeptide (TPR) repeat protein